MSRRLPGSPVWALLGCMLLAACVAAPTSGPVQHGLSGPAPANVEPLVRPLANPPRPGMTPPEVVAGFVNAAAAVGDDYRIAREYLTDEADQAWDPGAGVAVMESESPELVESDGAVVADYLQVGSVSSSGVYTDLAPAARASSEFRMAQVEGEWRIAAAPAGLLLDEGGLQTAFEARHTYFLDPSGTVAVPDVRLVPRTGTQALATALVAALLAGPSQWISPAVRTAIPQGVQLAIGAVPVTDGVARVELQGPEVTLDEASIEQFGAQFAWTLRQVPDLTSMEISVDGRPVAFQDQRGPVSLEHFAGYDPDVVQGAARLYGLTEDGRFALVEDDDVLPLSADGAEAPPASSVAVAPRGSTLAGASADASSMLIGSVASSGPPPQVIPATVAAGPSIDGRGRVWWVDPSGAVRVARSDGDGQLRVDAVDVVGAAGPVLQVRPSRDGTRAALIIGPRTHPRVHLGVIAAADPLVRIEGLRPLDGERDAVDVAWHSAAELTVLLPSIGLVERHDLMGSTVAAFAVPETATTVTDAPQDTVVLSLADGTAGRLTGNGVRIIEGLRAPAYPG